MCVSPEFYCILYTLAISQKKNNVIKAVYVVLVNVNDSIV